MPATRIWGELVGAMSDIEGTAYVLTGEGLEDEGWDDEVFKAIARVSHG